MGKSMERGERETACQEANLGDRIHQHILNCGHQNQSFFTLTHLAATPATVAMTMREVTIAPSRPHTKAALTLSNRTEISNLESDES